MEPSQRQQAEEQLEQIHKIIGFAPSLLQVVMANDVPTPVRQAGVVYLKNMINTKWEKEHEEGKPVQFTIHEQDRAMIRDAIVDAIVQAPDVIKSQLCVCLKTIIKHDFPNRWTQIVDKIHIYLQNQDVNSWMGALLALYQLIKSHEYLPNDKRTHLIEAMKLLLPMMYTLINQLLQDQSEQSMLIQKQILKCFHSVIKYHLPMTLITRDIFFNWMEILRQVTDRPVPDETLQVDEDDRMNLPWWKCKKWAVHTLYRVFEKYGSPMNVSEEYNEFAEWYLTTFTGGILEVLLRILDRYRNKVYVSPRVIQQTLNYIDQCIKHAHSWKLLKPHMFAIIQDVLFPLMAHSESDEELWAADPYEYIRIKSDMYEDFISPVTAGQTLLISACKKRKGILHPTMQFCMQVLNNPDNKYGPQHRDGAFHMVGTLNEIVLKKPIYRDHMDTLLTQYVLPEFSSPLGYMRARACWMLHNFASVKFKNDQFLVQAVELISNTLLHDTELPVKVEAAIALQMLLGSQEKVFAYFEPKVKDITLELLNILRETENDNVVNVLQKIVPLYTEQLMPMAVNICEHLSNTFNKVIYNEFNSDCYALTAMGLLSTMETVLNVMENNAEIMKQLEKPILSVVVHILQNNVAEYYEEAMSLLCSLTAKTVSEDMWKVLKIIYDGFDKDGIDYFTEMMPLLHNYVIVDTDAFLSNENHIIALFDMAKRILNSDCSAYSEIHAAKLLEVMVLQCKGKIDNCLPSFVEVVLSRLSRIVEATDLRVMLLQVLLAILYSNPHHLFSILNKMQESIPDSAIAAHFIKQWINDMDCFLGLHDRKLCILSLCTLLEMGQTRPNIDDIVPKLLPSCLTLFDGLQRAYKTQAECENETSSSYEDDDDEEGDEVLSTDEDDIDDTGNEYLANLARQVTKNSADQGVNLVATVEDDDDSDDDDTFDDDASIECYTTPLDQKDCLIDEFITFKNTLSKLSTTEPELYHAMTRILNNEQETALKEVLVLADQRKAQQESKLIEQRGGYTFTVPASVPTSFKFGS